MLTTPKRWPQDNLVLVQRVNPGGFMHADALLRQTILAAAMSTAIGSMAAAENSAAPAQEIGYIDRITGSALVNKGERYVDGTEGMPLSTGDRVMSLAESTAVLQFNDGCRYTMKENELITVPSMSPCVFTKGPSDRLSVAVLPPAPPSQVVVPVVVPATNLAWVPLAAAGVIGAGALVPDDDEVRLPISP